MAVSREQRRQVMERAGNRCEYCRMPAELDNAPFQVDHVRAQKHHGPTTLVNLAWTCFPCNNQDDRVAYRRELIKEGLYPAS